MLPGLRSIVERQEIKEQLSAYYKLAMTRA